MYEERLFGGGDRVLDRVRARLRAGEDDLIGVVVGDAVRLQPPVEVVAEEGDRGTDPGEL